ncbi:TPR repeat-containing thioredoxin TTL1-like isoform X2 [Phragmites australis]|uniref:TPR repeat-containing thioredoxin TTL1-like isoform X2 n=1 Tax=Phragmites australis TaxID=29695 RepID=UPI002D793783|nr:TPR repeat-containing thioredoxin TTL1-like isoform X2 [Phragmites australis]
MAEADRVRLRAAALTLDGGVVWDKPDKKTDLFAHLGSPVSPLRLRPATTSSSSSSAGSAKSPALGNAAAVAVGIGGRGNHSGELVAESNPPRPLRHRRSGSGPLIFSGGSSSAGSGGGGGCGSGSTASSQLTNALPTGNIFPSGRVAGAAAAPQPPRTRPVVLGSGTGHYGHGNIMRCGGGGGGMAPSRSSIDATLFHSNSSRSPASCPAPPGSGGGLQEVTRAGNEWYKKGRYGEALQHYDRALALCPDSAACRGNRAAALIGLGRLAEALSECEEAVRLDPASARAHGRLAGLCLRLGMVDKARMHFTLVGNANLSDPAEWQKLHEVESHQERCMDARKTRDWKSALREADAAIANGADSSQLLLALRSEALLRLHKFEEADSTIASLLKLDNASLPSMPTKLSGMAADSYVHIVQAQVNMAFGRFDSAVALAEKARLIDPGNSEVGVILNNVRLVARARSQGNDLFKAGKFAEASIAYGEGLKHEPSNPVLYCNRAACWSKLGWWAKAIEDCNEALRVQPNYTKALLRRAASYAKLERWADCVRDYEVLHKDLPGDTEVTESLFHAQVALKTTRGEEVSNMKFGGEVEAVTSLEQLQDAMCLPGVSVLYFMSTTNRQCAQITSSVDSLCTECPSVNFFKVNVDESPAVARAENVHVVPTLKIYKDGARVKEMICPSLQVLRYSVRHYAVSSS